MSTNQGLVFNVHVQLAPSIEAEIARLVALYGNTQAKSIDVQLWRPRPIVPHARSMTYLQMPRTTPTVVSYMQALPPDDPGDNYWLTRTIPLWDLQIFAVCTMEIQLGMTGIEPYRTPVCFRVMIDTGSYACWLFTDRITCPLPGPGNSYIPKLYRTRDPTGTGHLVMPIVTRGWEFFGGTQIVAQDYVDTLHLTRPGGSKMQIHFLFGGAIDVSPNVQRVDFDGIFGFGFSSGLNRLPNGQPVATLNSFFDVLIANLIISSPQMALSLSTVQGNSRMSLGTPPLEWTGHFTVPVSILSIPETPRSWLVRSPACRINGLDVQHQSDNIALIDTGTTGLYLEASVVTRFYNSIPSRYVQKPGPREPNGMYYIRDDTPLINLPTLEIGIGPDFLFIHPEAIMQVRFPRPLGSGYLVEGAIQCRGLFNLPFDVIGTPALVCMVAKFRKGPRHGVTSIETATFSFRPKHPRV